MGIDRQVEERRLTGGGAERLARRDPESGAVLILVAALLVGLIGVVALAVDVGHTTAVRTKLQATADASALAAAQDLPDEAEVESVAQDYAQTNYPGYGVVVKPADVAVGNWNPAALTFTAGGLPTNAVRVVARRSVQNANAVPTFFARVLGIQTVDVAAAAVAWAGSGVGTRFLIDDEMIDTDVPVIEDLADRLGVKTEDLLSDKDGDWFIDLPPGEVLMLPTGQVGDEGLFDIDHPQFPFGSDTSPSHEDFLNYNEDSSSWRYDLVPKRMLDPLVGVSRVNDPTEYPSWVGEGCVHVSPVYKSDISALNPVSNAPAVNALGLRRGLLAFEILSVGPDPDGSGSVLPFLEIRVCDPKDIVLSEVTVGTGLRIQLVQ